MSNIPVKISQSFIDEYEESLIDKVMRYEDTEKCDPYFFHGNEFHRKESNKAVDTISPFGYVIPERDKNIILDHFYDACQDKLGANKEVVNGVVDLYRSTIKTTADMCGVAAEYAISQEAVDNGINLNVAWVLANILGTNIFARANTTVDGVPAYKCDISTLVIEDHGGLEERVKNAYTKKSVI
jgi:hypothetical protein